MCRGWGAQNISSSIFGPLIPIVNMCSPVAFKNLLVSIRNVPACTQNVTTGGCSKASIDANSLDPIFKFGDKSVKHSSV